MNDTAMLGGAVDSMESTISELNEMAIQGLATMFDTRSRLFCFKLKRDGSSRLIPEGCSHRYTIMSLLGLHRRGVTGPHPAVDVQSILGDLLRSTKWITNIGDLGLLLWLCALAEPKRLEEVYSGLGVEGALARYHADRECRTMEVAWLLSGLSHAALAVPHMRRRAADLALKTYRMLEKNQGDRGIFGHLAAGGTLSSLIRGKIGSFADQVYPIYALTRFAQAYQAQHALRRALACADAICKAQGSLGQWWWHYDASSGQVRQRYPVYAVHQDGMAPMALFAVGEAAGVDFSEAIYKGLAWITGSNELHCDLREPSSGLIWRSIYRTKSLRNYFEEAREFVHSDPTATCTGNLKILLECRPYHLGWLLYAFAGRQERLKIAETTA